MGSGKGNTGPVATPRNFDQFRNVLGRTSLQELQPFIGDTTFGAQNDGTFSSYGTLESGGIGFGGDAETGPIIGFDERGRLFDNTMGGPEGELAPIGRSSRTVQNMLTSQWFGDLINRINTPSAAPTPTPNPNVPTPSTPAPTPRQTGPSAEEQQRRFQEEQIRIAEENDRDQLLADYYDAANAATTAVTNQVRNERSNAAIMGIRYNEDSELTNQRIREYFTSIWDERNEQNLDDLIARRGAPEDFQGFTLRRIVQQPDSTQPVVGDTGGEKTTDNASSPTTIIGSGARTREEEPRQRSSIVGNIPPLGSSQNILGR